MRATRTRTQAEKTATATATTTATKGKTKTTATTAAKTTTTATAAARRAYLDEIAAFFATHGLPPMAGRIVAHLLLCEPAAQSFESLCAATGASRATVSTMTQLLARLGLVERRPGPRRRFTYLLPDDAWTRLLEDDLRSATRLRELARKGLRIPGAGAGSRARLQGMHEFYDFLERETTSALDRWRKRARR